MSIKKKYTDWRSWWDGLRTNLMKCIGTAGITWLGTNGLSSATGLIKGIDWEQAIGFFAVHIAFEVFTYMQKNQPQVVTETTETTITQKTTTTTPENKP